MGAQLFAGHYVSKIYALPVFQVHYEIGHSWMSAIYTHHTASLLDIYQPVWCQLTRSLPTWTLLMCFVSNMLLVCCTRHTVTDKCKCMSAVGDRIRTRRVNLLCSLL